MSSPGLLKRPRSESSSPSRQLVNLVNLPVFEKDTELWYGDGSVVLVCEHSLGASMYPSPHIGFRVYKGVLSANCEVFRDMFDVCSPSDQDSKDDFEDCPVIVLQDTATEMRRFLKALLNREFVTLPFSPRLSHYGSYQVCQGRW